MAKLDLAIEKDVAAKPEVVISFQYSVVLEDANVVPSTVPGVAVNACAVIVGLPVLVPATKAKG